MVAPTSLRPLPHPAAPATPPPASVRAEGAKVAAPADAFAPAKVAATGTRPADGLKAFNELSAKQQGLLGADGRALYEGLTPKQKGVFLLLTQRMERAGVDLSGLRLKGGAEGIRGDNKRFDLRFEPDPAALARLKASAEAGVRSGKFFEEKPYAPFHGGMSDWGVRENRSKYTVQLGIGKDGAFVDMDRYNPRSSGWNHVKHWGEILTPGTMDPFKVASELGEDLWSKLPSAPRAA